MSATAAKLVDERVDVVAATARGMLAARIPVAGGSAVLTAIAIDWRLALGWFSVYALIEAAIRICTAPLGRGEPLDRPRRLAYLGTVCAMTLLWCVLAAVYWTTEGEPYRIAAMCMLAGTLVHMQGFSFRSPGALLAVGVPAGLTWVLVPVVLGGYQGGQLAALTVGLAMFLAYVAATTRANMGALNALAAARREAEDANAAKSAFLATVSHELRTPLNGVMGMARGLRRTPLDTRQQQHVETILRSADSLLTILNDVLDLSKIEAGRMELEVAVFDLRRLAEQAVDLWSEQAAAKGLTLTCQVDPDLPPALLGDETRVRQILLNLVSNALKFTDQGAIRIELSPAPAADGDGGVAFVVRDTGIGLSEEHRDLLFRPFTQAEASIARRYGGTGLGLSICRELAERMGGAISVESALGQGSAFRVWLPLPAAEPATEEAAPPDDLPPLRVLVADDNPINQAVAQAILEAAGCDVELAADGDAALAQLAHGGFDLVLMDVHMPRMDGVEAVGRIRAGQAGAADIPVIALTADAMPGEESRLKGLGFDALQGKPVRPAALLGAIAEVMSGREPLADRSAA